MQPHHERIEDPAFRLAVEEMDAGDVAALSQLLAEYPDLIRSRVHFDERYFRDPGLLPFVAENPVRRGRMPANAVEVAKVLLDAGSDPQMLEETLGLVASGRVARECGLQLPLIDLLCAHGASPDRALRTATLHGEFAAVQRLIEQGARPDLATFAALGDTQAFLVALPGSDAAQRHLALAYAAQFGRADLVRALLEAGEDPNRFDPPGAHEHGTPLHQAAVGGHRAVVELLVGYGARPDVTDRIWEGTPAGWARHGGHTELADALDGLKTEPNA